MSDLLDTLPGRLADDVTFHSPVATYRGRDTVEHLIRTIDTVVHDVVPVRVVTDADLRVTFFTARVAEHELDGVLAETLGDGERIVELRLLLRPLEPLIAAVKAMGAALGR